MVGYEIAIFSIKEFMEWKLKFRDSGSNPDGRTCLISSSILGMVPPSKQKVLIVDSSTI